MFLDCFQLGLEKVKLFESVNRPNTTHKLVVMWSVTLELVWTQVFPLFFLGAVFGHELNFDWENLIFAALSLTLLKEIHVLVVVISCGLWIVFSTLHWSFWHDRRQSIFVGVGVGGRARTMDWQQALYFFLLPSSRVSRFAQMPCLPHLSHKALVMQANASHFRLDHLTRNALPARNN